MLLRSKRSVERVCSPTYNRDSSHLEFCCLICEIWEFSQYLLSSTSCVLDAGVWMMLVSGQPVSLFKSAWWFFNCDDCRAWPALANNHHLEPAWNSSFQQGMLLFFSSFLNFILKSEQLSCVCDIMRLNPQVCPHPQKNYSQPKEGQISHCFLQRCGVFVQSQ